MPRLSKAEGSGPVTPADVRDIARRIREMTIGLRLMAKSLELRKIERLTVANMRAIGRAFDELNLWQTSLNEAMNAKEKERLIPPRRKK
jgi:hypothetical protein